MNVEQNSNSRHPAVPPERKTETILHNFTGSDEADSHGRLLIGKDGTLYGTASSDGPDSGGTAFRLVP